MNGHYFDHPADIGIIGKGSSLEASFIDAAKAMFALMTDLSQIHPVITIEFVFEENDIELAFVTWLNLLLAKAQANHLVFSQFQLTKDANLWRCQAIGETWHDEIERGIEVKGATLTMLSVKEHHGTWEAKCVVDV